MKSKLLSFSIALLASFCLWIYVVTVVNQEVSNQPIDNIAVTFAGADQIREDSNLVITDGAETVVDLKVTCSRATLSKLTADNVSAVVDVSRIKKPGDYTMSYTLVYPTGVANSDVSAYGEPRTISFRVERFTSKTVAVKGLLNGSVADGYYAPSLECTPKEILIEGPESLVNSVEYAQVILEKDDLTETVIQSCPFTLIDANGDPVESENVTAAVDGLTVDTIEVRQEVLPMKEVPLMIDFIPGGGATAEDVIWSCEPNTITVAGEADVLERINQIVVAQFDLATLVEPVSEDLPVSIPNSDLVNVSGLETVRVNLSINTNQLATKTVRVTDCVTVGLQDGYAVEVMTVQIPVTIRGPIDEINRITADDVTAVVDVSALNVGTQNVPVSIEIRNADASAALGEYSAVVSLTRE